MRPISTPCVAYSQGHLQRAIFCSAWHAGPELVFPALPTALIVAVVVKLQPGGVYFGRPMHPSADPAVLRGLPFIYGIADCTENLLTTNAFGDGVAWSFAATLPPWASSLKFVAPAISSIVIIRFAIFRLTPPGDPRSAIVRRRAIRGGTGQGRSFPLRL